MRKSLLVFSLVTFAAQNFFVAAQDNHAATSTTDVPVRQVTLFSSGVGYFEHDGSVRGNASTELSFKTTQINDILKSLVLQDESGGRIGVVTYPSQDPLEKTLHSFSVDLSGNPPLSDLLNQLRGARVSVSSGGENYDGTILGVEEHEENLGAGDNVKIVKTHTLNLISSNGTIRSLPMERMPEIQFDDPQLQAEMNKALDALAQARDQEKKAVTINFNGDGERRVRIGYVIETPIWKTSYRLVLPRDSREAAAQQEQQSAKPDEGKPDEKNPGEMKSDKPEKPDEKAKLQGWAIVENQTDADWNNVALSLVSGRPISFVQDLYQPLYLPRPVVQPELYTSLKPQTYGGGIDEEISNFRTFTAPVSSAVPQEADAKDERSRLHKFGLAKQAELGSDAFSDKAVAGAYAPERARGLMDVTASVASAASTANLGELFQYTIGNVTLARQRSAMIPILNDEISAERLSIYNRSVLATHPLNGARLCNTTGKHLLQGPITVFDEGGYSGDARIDDTPPGQQRLLSYGIDLQLFTNSDKAKDENTVQTARILKGTLELQRKQTFTQDYVTENKSDKDKTLVIEHPFRANWKLVNTPKPIETTDSLYRFQTTVSAKKTETFTVSEERVNSEKIGILPIDFGQLEIYSRTGKIPPEVKAALDKLIAMKRAMAETQTQIDDRNNRIEQIAHEQDRIRENLKAVAQNSDYANNLLKKLNDQETKIEGLQKEIEDLKAKLETQRQDLENYLGSLNVG